MYGHVRWALVVAAFFGVSLVARADEVDFKNGDKLTGKIESLESGKLTISTAMAGKLILDVNNIKTFSSDGPVSIQLNNGRRIDEKVSLGSTGQFSVPEVGKPGVEAIPIARVKYINFNHDWHGAVTVGGSIFRGNTRSETLNATANAIRRTETDRITADAGYLFAREHSRGVAEEHETANNWWVGGKYDYFFTPKFYGYVNGRVERDLLADIDLRLTPGVGAGYQWVDKPDFHFSTEGGVSYLYRSYSNDGSDESVALRFAYHLDKKLNSHLSLQHNLEYFPGLDSLDNYYFNTDIGIRASITSHMFAEFKTLYKFDAQPAPGASRSDTQFILGVGWNF